MKKLLFPVFTLTLATILLAVMPTEAEGAIYDDTVRLHILANSDSEIDQTLKLEIRDSVLDEFGRELSVFESVENAESELSEKLSEIEAFVENEIKKKGFNYGAYVALGEEWYETRDYEGFSLPAGYYTSLRIIIGDGEGKNWWCVMFPPLCLDAAINDNGYTEAEDILIKNKYSVKFKILELFSELSK